MKLRQALHKLEQRKIYLLSPRSLVHAFALTQSQEKIISFFRRLRLKVYYTFVRYTTFYIFIYIVFIRFEKEILRFRLKIIFILKIL